MDQTLEPSLGISSKGISSFPSFAGSRTILAMATNDLPAFDPGHHVPPSLAPPSGNITEVPPISRVFPSKPLLGIPTPEINPTQCTHQNSIPDEGTWKVKKPRVLKPKALEVFLSLGKDFQWSEVMDTTERVLVGRVRDHFYSTTRLKQWATEVWGHHLAKPLVV